MDVRALLLAMALSGWATTALAFEGIEAERPFLGMTSRALEQGVYQLEQGAWLSGGSLSFPSRHRLGLGSDAELILTSALVTFDQGQGRMENLSIGGKWCVTGGGPLPELGLVALTEVGAEGELSPRVTMVLDLPLFDAWSLGSNFGASWAASDTRLHYSAALAWVPCAWLKLCAEAVGERDTTTGSQRLGLDGGLGWLVEPSTQVDLLLYKGVTPQAPDWSGSIGVSKRWGM